MTASITAPPQPQPRLCIGVTGHRQDNAAFDANAGAVAAALGEVLDIIAAAAATRAAASATVSAPAPSPVPRLHSLLAGGFDQLAATAALDRNWELVAILPFGKLLNAAINAHPVTPAEARALLEIGSGGVDGGGCSEAVRVRADAILSLETRGRCFALADRDAVITADLLAALDNPADAGRARALAAHTAERAAIAGRVMIEQSDVVIGLWDGTTTNLVGGTGHTIFSALEHGAPIVWIDPRTPEKWRILQAPESLAGIGASMPPAQDRATMLTEMVRAVLSPATGDDAETGPRALDTERWHDRSSRFWHGYRRVEALFGATSWKARLGSLLQRYERPDAIETGSGAALLAAGRALPGQETGFADRIGALVLRRFAWADGISSYLSDNYRGGMTLNFLFSALAVTGGIAYLPVASPDQKWIFAVIEATLLAAIVINTGIGQRRRWHARWFETRRVAEYLRQAPALLLMGVARAPGRWPRGTSTSWPEWLARQALREVGLPRVTITAAYLRQSLSTLLLPHVISQRDYHRFKARRLADAHHRLDVLSGWMFNFAIVAVVGYLSIKLMSVTGVLDYHMEPPVSLAFTFLGVALPTFGGAIAGIRYFGDFERFSAISDVTAEKLDAAVDRIELLLQAPDAGLDYARVAELAHLADAIVVAEIENWQAVFGGKHITVPV